MGFMHIVEGDDAAGDDMREEAVKVGEDVLVNVGAVNKKKMDGLVPGFSQIPADAAKDFDVLRDTQRAKIVLKFLERIILIKVRASVKTIQGKNFFPRMPAAQGETTGGPAFVAANLHDVRAVAKLASGFEQPPGFFG